MLGGLYWGPCFMGTTTSTPEFVRHLQILNSEMIGNLVQWNFRSGKVLRKCTVPTIGTHGPKLLGVGEVRNPMTRTLVCRTAGSIALQGHCGTAQAQTSEEASSPTRNESCLACWCFTRSRGVDHYNYPPI